ncbi:glycosyl transferase family protein [Candidatus Magnetoovum chiemensis]|nr:glycosyl transferase family protein [Candidatus Magnetoovum chiemensis]
MNRIELIKKIDGLVGVPLVWLLYRLRRAADRGDYTGLIKRVLIIRPGGIGDAVLLLYALSQLKMVFPEVLIDVLAEKRNGAIFRLSPHLNRIYLYDSGLDMFGCLKNAYDVVIDTEQWHRFSAVFAYLTGGLIRVGFDTNNRGLLFTRKVRYSLEEYEVHSFLRLIGEITKTNHVFNSEEPFLFLKDDVIAKAYELTAEVSKPFVGILPGASVKEKLWVAERYGELAAALEAIGVRAVILGSKAERETALKIKHLASNALDLTGKTSLIESAAVIKLCAVLISPDSGLMHIAYSLGVRTVCLFGVSSIEKWAPKGRNTAVISKQLNCAPCSKFAYIPPCKNDIKCMSLIAVDEVLNAVKESIGF